MTDHIICLQRDESSPDQAHASVDRGREEGRRIHCPAPGNILT